MGTARTNGTTSPRREAWGSLRKLPSGRWQARYPAPDGETYTARTEDDKPLTFLTKTDARAWLAGVHTKIARHEWEAPSASAARRRMEAEQERARSVGFAEYANRWIAMIRVEPNRSGKRRAIGTVRAYKGDREEDRRRASRRSRLGEHHRPGPSDGRLGQDPRAQVRPSLVPVPHGAARAVARHV